MNKRKMTHIITYVKSIDFLPLIFAYIIMVAFFAFTSEYFFTFSNFMNIAMYAAIIGILSCTTTLVIVAGKIDFSAGSVIALCACIMGIMTKEGASIWLAMFVSLVIASVIGAVNGFLIAYVGINPFIATLAGMQIFRGLAYLITNARSITITSSVLKLIGRDVTFGIPNAVILMLIIVVIISFIARKTTFGRRIFVIGGSEKVAYLSGINVKKSTLIMFVVHGLVTGIVAIVYTAQLGAALPSAAMNLNFQSISAAVLGGVSLTGGKGSIVGAVIGAMLLGTLNNGMIMLDIQTFWQDVIIGFVLLFAVTLDIIKNRTALKV